MKKKGFWGAVLSALFVILYYGGAFVLFACQPDMPLWAKLLLCLIPAGIIALTVGVTVQRIREIRSGETDDLDKY
jgi:uncharacterized membrane protein YhaH (DUF805 family)